MATYVDVAAAKHPDSFEGHAIQPLEGKSLLTIFEGKPRPHPAPVFWEHEGNRAVRLDQWKLVARHARDWELYDLDADRTEQNNLAAAQPDRVKEMSAPYDAWANRCNVLPVGQLPPPRKTVPAKNKSVAASSTEN
jgi:arylsulfatase